MKKISLILIFLILFLVNVSAFTYYNGCSNVPAAELNGKNCVEVRNSNMHKRRMEWM